MKIPVNSLWMGMTVQPTWRQYPGQVALAKNATLDPLEGARKRNATTLVADISTDLLNPIHNHGIISLRQFRIFVREGVIVALDGDGSEVEVIDETDTGYTYLIGTNLNNIEYTAGIDTIVLVNKLTAVEMEATPDYEVLSEVLVYSDLFKSPLDWSTPGDPLVDPDPTEAEVGAHWQVITDENLDCAGYYVKTADGWDRCAAPNDPDGRASRETWPHLLVYNPSTEKFYYREMAINDRLSGNSITNPVFPFVGSTIESVQFMDGRLCFIGRSTMNFAAAGDIFTVFVDNVNNITDADPISTDINFSNVGLPLRSEQVGDSIVVICENGALSYASVQDALSPVKNNGKLRQVSDKKFLDIYPGTDGKRLVTMDHQKRIWVFQWDEETRSIAELGSLNQHVIGIFDAHTIDGLHVDGTTTYVTTTIATTFVHDMFMNADGTLAQSAWGQYEFTGNERLRYIDTWQDKIRFYVRSPQGHSFLEYQHRKPISPTDCDFDPRMDRREVQEGTYIPATDETEFVLSGRNADLNNVWVVTTRTPDDNISQEWHRPVWVHGRNFRIKGKWTGYEHYLGWDFNYNVVLSKLSAGPSTANLVFRGQQGFFFVDTTDIEVRVTRQGEATHKSIKSSSFVLGAKSMDAAQSETGELRLLILGNAKDTKVEVFSNTPGSCTFSAIEWNVDAKGRG